eukprot:TRINITY_DN83786_c0_g1_i1.p1 TRINITY_DN83786_c0_g1~~TRINITY_DN83786_c0_g1_i1.p1  ORF type:complete len:225 (+),score=43.24 TRINITY_DN83786_c0_g1_i1:118-792(+)
MLLRSASHLLFSGSAQCRRLSSGISEAAYVPLQELQAAYDEVLIRPWQFPPHVQRLHEIAESEQRLRQPFIDQGPLAHGQQTLLTARKVIYAIVGRSNPRFQICVTKFSCTQDFLERSAKELRAAMKGPTSRSPAKRRRGQAAQGLALEGPEALMLYALESLDSDHIPYHRISQQRLHHWAGLLQSVMSGCSATEAAEEPLTSEKPPFLSGAFLDGRLADPTEK